MASCAQLKEFWSKIVVESGFVKLTAGVCFGNFVIQMLDKGFGCVGIQVEDVFVGYALQRSLGGFGYLSIVLDVHFCLGGVPKYFPAFENDGGFGVLLGYE